MVWLPTWMKPATQSSGPWHDSSKIQQINKQRRGSHNGTPALASALNLCAVKSETRGNGLDMPEKDLLRMEQLPYHADFLPALVFPGVRFFLTKIITSNVVLLLYTTLEVYT